MTADCALAPDRYARSVAAPRGFPQSFVREGQGGEPLVLLHGWPETARIWWRNVGPLAEAGFDVVAPDLRGFGESGTAPDGAQDVASHSADLHALLRRELGFRRVTLVGGDLGAMIAQDLAFRFPGFVRRLVIFNAPLPPLHDTAPGADRDLSGPELATPDAGRRRVASCYAEGGWASPGGFDAEAVAFHADPFAATGPRAFAALASACASARRAATASRRANPTETLVLFAPADRATASDFEARAERVFANRIGPFRVARCGHFLAWEAAEVLDGAIRHLCRPALARSGEQTAFVALGSNLGDRERHLVAAFAALRGLRGVRDVVASRVYETDPVGPGDQEPYLNAVARLRTTLSPRALLEALLAIERREGRLRTGVRDEARTLDLDLLLHGDARLAERDLVVPHPRLAERAFVLEPLCDLAPELRLPGGGAPIAQLAAARRDPAAVRVRER